MFSPAKPSDFFREVSQNPQLKFTLTWITFCVLVVPTAFLMSIGVPEEYALPLMLAAVLPSYYTAFCVLRLSKVVRSTSGEQETSELLHAERGLDLLVKRVADAVGAAILLVLFSPLLLSLALLVKLTSPGPVFYRQVRCGLGGRRFTLYKFRSLVADADQRRDELAALNEAAGLVFKMVSDPRCTRVGRWLRRFNLDDLPQIWNVLKGDMSFVGPRPPLPEEVEKYERQHRRRLRMRPGLAGLWALERRDPLSFERWLELDLTYEATWSLLLDLKIILKTIPQLLAGHGAN